MNRVEKEQIRSAVFRALDTVREFSLDESALPNDESDVLLGEEAGLDSMDFVNFVVALEEEINRVTGQPLDLVNELNSPDTATGPLSTVGQFIDFLHKTVQSNPADKS